MSQFSEFTQLELNDKSPIYFSNSVIDLEFIFDKNLSLIQKLKNTKKKTAGNLINISRITKFINYKSRI